MGCREACKGHLISKVTAAVNDRAVGRVAVDYRDFEIISLKAAEVASQYHARNDLSRAVGAERHVQVADARKVVHRT